MKKLILTSAAILFIGLTSFAQDGSKCAKKCEKKCDITACTKGEKSNKKCDMNGSSTDKKCSKGEANSCAKKCKMDASGNDNNKGIKK